MNTKKPDTINLSLKIEDSDRARLIYTLKNFWGCIIMNRPDIINSLEYNQLEDFDRTLWVYSNFADYLEAKYFDLNEIEYLKKLPTPWLLPRFRILETRFRLWFKYAEIALGIKDDLISHYLTNEINNILYIARNQNNNPLDSKRDLHKSYMETVDVILWTKKLSDTKFLKECTPPEMDKFYDILVFLQRSQKQEHRRDLQIWGKIEKDAIRTTTRGIYAKYYQHITADGGFKKAGRKSCGEKCPHCGGKLYIFGNLPHYRGRVTYYKCADCGSTSKKINSVN